jgi:hypothetical protein
MQTAEWPGFTGSAAAEAAKEIELTHRQPGASGDVLWRAAFVMRDAAGDAALARAFPGTALIPASPWLGGLPAAKPLLTVNKASREISWKPAGSEPVRQWLLQEKFGGAWATEILPAAQTNRLWTAGGAGAMPQMAAVAAVTRFGNLGPSAVVTLESR